MKYLNQLSSGRSTRCLLFLTVLGLLTLTSIRSYGQAWPACNPCPTTIPPTTVAWTSGSVVVSLQLCPTGPPCTVKICYCFRETSPGNQDYTVSSIMIDGCPGCYPNLDSVISIVFTWVRVNNPMGFKCKLPCPFNTIWAEIVASCWSVTVVNGITVYQPCSGLAYCNTPWTVCCDPTTGARTYTRGTTVMTGTCTITPNCTIITCP